MATTLSGVITGSGGGYSFTRWISPCIQTTFLSQAWLDPQFLCIEQVSSSGINYVQNLLAVASGTTSITYPIVQFQRDTLSNNLQLLTLDLSQSSNTWLCRQSPPSQSFNVLRYSSGWAAQNYLCWGCTDTGCLADVLGRASFYILSPVVNKQTLYTINNSINYTASILKDIPLAMVYNYPQQNLIPPVFSNLGPAANSRLLSSEFYSIGGRITDMTVSGLNNDSNFIWIRRPNQGRTSGFIYDHFNAYTQDYKLTSSGYGWTMISGTLLDRCIVNENYKWKATIDGNDYYADTYEDAIRLLLQGVTASGGFITTDYVSSVGTGFLELTTSQNTNRKAPGLYLSLPSGITSWEFETKVMMYHDLKLPNTSNPQAAGIHLLCTAGTYGIMGASPGIAGTLDCICGYSNGSLSSYGPRTTNRYQQLLGYNCTDPYPLWLKFTYNSPTLLGKSSEDGKVWTIPTTATIPIIQNGYIGLSLISSVINSRITAFFDYAKFSTSVSGVIDNLGMNNDWELISVSGSPINSNYSSGSTTINTTIVNQIRYTNSFYNNLLPDGSNFVVRSVAEDTWGFKNWYIVDSSTAALITCDSTEFLELVNDYPVSCSGLDIVSEQILYNQLYCTPVYQVQTANTWRGQGALDFTSGGTLTVSGNVQDISWSDDWTVQLMIKTISLSAGVLTPLFTLFDLNGNTQISMNFNYPYLYPYIQTIYQSNSVPYWGSNIGVWRHVAFVKKGNWLYIFIDGFRYYDGIDLSSYQIPAAGYVVFGPANAYIDLVMISNKALWTYDFDVPNVMDSMYLIRTLNTLSFDVSMNIIPDTCAPRLVPVHPAADNLNACTASGIVFDILDDFTGVDWDTLDIRINDEVIWKGGSSYCEWVDCIGRLTYEERGSVDQEDLNQILYPSGTVYDNSGAWGRRFYYTYTGDIPYDSWVTVSASGRDVYGISTESDALIPNYFNESYTFKIITNANIRFDNFFMDVGDSMLLEDSTILSVDIWNTNYPDIDIDESSVALTLFDGVDLVMCSGISFSTYYNVDGILVHTLLYTPESGFSWQGHRSIQVEVRAKDTNTYCDIHNITAYTLTYGLDIFWDHTDKPVWAPDTKIPISIHGTTYDYLLAELGKGWMIWTAPLKMSDFYVILDRIWAQFKVCLRAMSYKLQYSEDVPVTIKCQDNSGNLLVYTFTFRTGDKSE